MGGGSLRFSFLMRDGVRRVMGLGGFSEESGMKEGA